MHCDSVAELHFEPHSNISLKLLLFVNLSKDENYFNNNNKNQSKQITLLIGHFNWTSELCDCKCRKCPEMTQKKAKFIWNKSNIWNQFVESTNRLVWSWLSDIFNFYFLNFFTLLLFFLLIFDLRIRISDDNTFP